MNVRQILRYVSALMIGVVMATPGATVWAAEVEISSSDPLNGITDIYSATFDPPLTPGGDPFFGGTPPVSRAIIITPNPTRVLRNAVPCGLGNGSPPCVAPPQAGSYLDLTLSNGNTQLTIADGTIALPILTLIISGSTFITAPNAGMVFYPTQVPVPNQGQLTTTVDANGVAIFEVEGAPSTIVDFSTFSEILVPPDGECTDGAGGPGPLCALVAILTLDMIRYRLTIDYDPTFTSFTVDFIGQTANNSMVFATLNTGVPDITITDSVAPVDDQQVPFGTVTELASADQTVTVTNDGTADLTIGNIMPPATVFSIPADNCSGLTLLPAASCTLTVRFSPPSAGAFSDSFAVPSDDPVNPTVTVSLNGTGSAIPTPNITVTDSAPPIDDLQIPFGNITEGNTSDHTVTVANDGDADLVLGNIAQADPLAVPFSVPVITDTCSGQTMIPAADCTFVVHFAPATLGSFNDSLDIPSNDPDENPVTVNVSGTGTAIPASDITVLVSIEPEDDLQIPFGDIKTQRISDAIIIVINDGNENLVIGMIAQANPLADPFSVLTDNCSEVTLAPTDSCTINVRLSPLSTGNFSDSLDIPSNDPDEPSVTVDLSGQGVIDPVDTIKEIDSGFFGAGSVSPGTLLAVLLLVIGVRVRQRRQ